MEADLSEICFLDEVLYWVAFQRAPFAWTDVDGDDFRDLGMAGYDVDCALHRLSEDECKRIGLPQDPRMSFDWAFAVKPHDTFETITAQATRAADKSDEDDTAPQKAHEEAARLSKELKTWYQRYQRAIELPAAKVYVALKEGTLTAKGILLSHIDPDRALAALAKEGHDLAEAESVEIPKEFWSQREIFWEQSAARNETQHYCQIFCETESVLSLFPLKTLTQGVEVSGVERYGSFFILNDTGLAPARPTTRRSREGGRPQQYPWDHFHVEVACVVQRNGMPDKKEAAIEYFRKWFMDRTGKSPSRSMIGEKLTPYYRELVRNSVRKLPSELPASSKTGHG
jgi:hypothetical protein